MWYLLLFIILVFIFCRQKKESFENENEENVKYGTIYKDPIEMTLQEREQFKKYYRSDMSVNDYVHWLHLYENDIQQLEPMHYQNYIRVLNGEKLVKNDMPVIKGPLNIAQYFDKLHQGGKISIEFPEYPSNKYNEHNYADYRDYVAPTEVDRTWITGISNLLETPKVDAHALNEYIRPDVTVRNDIEKMGN